jgi:hypothetical protein
MFTNLRYITTKTTSSIKATPEPAPITIYVVCSSPVRIINYFEKNNAYPNSICFEIKNIIAMTKDIYS